MTDAKIQDPRYPPAKTTELQVEQGGQQIEAVLEKKEIYLLLLFPLFHLIFCLKMCRKLDFANHDILCFPSVIAPA